jgi:hypothetical protein
MALLAAAVVLGGCRRAEVRVQRVPKDLAPIPVQTASAAPATTGGMDLPAPSAMATPPAPATARPQIKWTLPAGWAEKPATEFRVASFNVPGNNGQVADVAVTPLPATGHELELVNMWRSQMQLPPLSGPDPDKGTETVAVGTNSARLFDVASEKAVIGDGLRGRMLIATLTREGTSWFFKMTGEESFVSGQKPVFLQFLKSVSFEDANDTASSMADAHASMNAGPAVAATDAGSPSPWTAPTDWKSLPPSQFLVAKYAINGTGGKAEVNVSMLSGEGGGVQMNVNRWRGQLGLSPVDEDGLAGLTGSLDTPGGKAVTVDLKGTNKQTGQPHQRLIGVILPQGGQTWFYKLMGDEAIVAEQKDAFTKFVQSPRTANAP